MLLFAAVLFLVSLSARLKGCCTLTLLICFTWFQTVCVVDTAKVLGSDEPLRVMVCEPVCNSEGLWLIRVWKWLDLLWTGFGCWSPCLDRMCGFGLMLFLDLDVERDSANLCWICATGFRLWLYCFKVQMCRFTVQIGFVIAVVRWYVCYCNGFRWISGRWICALKLAPPLCDSADSTYSVSIRVPKKQLNALAWGRMNCICS